jgi:hypothetical protein
MNERIAVKVFQIFQGSFDLCIPGVQLVQLVPGNLPCYAILAASRHSLLHPNIDAERLRLHDADENLLS